MNQRRNILLIVFVILLVGAGIFVGLYLVNQNQDIRQQAQEIPPTATPIATASATPTVPPIEFCYAIQDANSAADILYKINLETGEIFDQLTLETTGIEAFEYDASLDRFIVENSGVYGTVDPATGEFTAIEPDNSAFMSVNDVQYNLWQMDNLAYHPQTGELFNIGALVLDWNDPDEVPNLILYNIDPTDFSPLEDGFGQDTDFLNLLDDIEGTPTFQQVDSATINPLEPDFIYAGTAYDNTSPAFLVKFNIHTGERIFSQPIIVVDHPNIDFIDTQLIDVESATFTDEGELYVITGGGAVPDVNLSIQNQLFRIDPATAEATFIAYDMPYDTESLSCILLPAETTPTPVPTPTDIPVGGPEPSNSPTPGPTSAVSPTPFPELPQAGNGGMSAMILGFGGLILVMGLLALAL